MRWRRPAPAPATATATAAATGVVSPNDAYTARAATVEGGAVVVVDVERPVPLVIDLRAAADAPVPRWVTESLLFVRVMWGRV